MDVQPSAFVKVRYTPQGRIGLMFGPRQGAKYWRPSSQRTPTQDILTVVSATEGGSLAAAQNYDVCEMTAGLLQACERYGLVAKLLGSIRDEARVALEPLDQLGVEVRRGKSFRFWRADVGTVDTAGEIQKVFLGGSSGRIGHFDEVQEQDSRVHMAALATVLADPLAAQPQVDFWGRKCRGFALGKLAEAIEEAEQDKRGDPVAGAFVAAALSYAANNPLRAKLAYEHAAHTNPPEQWTQDWLEHCLTWFTKGPPEKPAPALYAHRYAAIRPVLEKLFALDLPDNAAELEGLLSTMEAQRILVHVLGYDLGPSGPDGDGVDGNWGAKTTAALLDVERRHPDECVTVDGVLDRGSSDYLKRVRDEALKSGKTADGLEVDKPLIESSALDLRLLGLLEHLDLLRQQPGWYS